VPPVYDSPMSVPEVLCQTLGGSCDSIVEAGGSQNEVLGEQLGRAGLAHES
jgi:hypothetical protein